MRKSVALAAILISALALLALSFTLGGRRSRAFWSRFPRPEGKDVRFGVNHPVDGLLEDIGSSGAGWISMYPLAVWDRLEPSEGSYDWRELDAAVLLVESMGMEPTVTLMPVSRWGTPESYGAYLNGSLGFCDLPDDLEAWRKFVEAAAERYDGDGVEDCPGLSSSVLNWHVLEEWPTFWHDRGDSTPDNPENAKRYVRLLEVTYEAIKSQIPGARIILAGISSEGARLLAFAAGYVDDPQGGIWHGVNLSPSELESIPAFRQLRADVLYMLDQGRDYFDVVDLHLQDAKLSFTEGKVAWLEVAMGELGYRKPIWSVESGGPFKRRAGDFTSRAGDPAFGPFTPRENAEFVVKMHVLAFSDGVERFQWNWRADADSRWDGPFQLIPLRDPSGRPKPAYYTYFVMQHFMNGFSSVREVPAPDGVRLFEVSFPDREVYVVWSDGPGEAADLSGALPWSEVRVVHIVTEVDPAGRPVMRADDIADSESVPVSATPEFLISP